MIPSLLATLKMRSTKMVIFRVSCHSEIPKFSTWSRVRAVLMSLSDLTFTGHQWWIVSGHTAPHLNWLGCHRHNFASCYSLLCPVLEDLPLSLTLPENHHRSEQKREVGSSCHWKYGRAMEIFVSGYFFIKRVGCKNSKRILQNFNRKLFALLICLVSCVSFNSIQT